MRGPMLLVAVLCVVGAAVWMLWRTGETVPLSSGPSQNIAGEEAGAEPEPGAAVGSAPGDLSADELPAAGEQAASSERVEAPTATGPDNLRVVRFADGSPVDGADVWFVRSDIDWSSFDEAEMHALNKLRHDDERAWFERLGQRVRTRADGGCHLAVGEQGAQISVWSGELYGNSYLREGEAEVWVVKLHVDRTLRVRVVDAAGRAAAGIEVSVERPAVDQSGPTRFGIGTTGDDGTVVYRHCQQNFGAMPTGQAEVQARAAGILSVSAPVDVREPPEEVVLRLPPTGTVRVALRDAEGQPLDARLLVGQPVTLRLFDERPSRDEEHYNSAARAPVTDGGVATFEHVALDKFAVVSMGYFGAEVRAPGPTLAEPVVDIELSEIPGGLVLAGTLHDPDDEPLRDQPFVVRYKTDRGSGSMNVTTNAEGTFRCALGMHAIGASTVFSFRCNDGGTQVGRDAKYSLELPARTVEAGLLDLGVVRLEASKPVLAGRLVRGPGVDAGRVFLQVQRRQGERWQDDWQLQVTFDGDRFTVPGSVREGEPLRVSVQKGPYLPVEPIECVAGTTDIEIELHAGGSVRATFLVDERTPVARLQIDCLSGTDRPSTGFHNIFAGSQGGRVENGRFERTWNGLVPGRYDLSVRCQGVDEPLLVLDAIEVPAAGEASDARLAEIDLRGRVHALEIRARAADGSEIRDADAYVVVCSSEQRWYGYSLREGVVTVAAPGPVDLRVVAPGHEMATLVAADRPQTVQLRAAQKVALRLGLPERLPDERALELTLEPDLGFSRRTGITLDTGRGMMLQHFFVENVVPGQDGSYEVPVRWPGAYEVTGRLQGSRLNLRGFEPRRFELPGSGELTIDLAAGALKQAIDSIGK